ncbi:unnamed protein product [Prunus armeniaca]
MMDIVDALQETTSIMGAKHLKLPCLLFHPKCAAGKYGNYYDFEFYTLLMTRPNTYYMCERNTLLDLIAMSPSHRNLSSMETTCVVKMKEYWPNPTAKDLTENVNMTKMLEDAGISIGMDSDPIVIIQVIGK